ncbi:molybdopterin molybdotransferase MoeA [Pararhizobium mangrovi]|uniref:Molybdopterin molybdenumtransferase n=1 Tax=Pararhizobium mangrovi TaxID=2590452 RepID=A0A506UAA6_9HYPH|nr:gephyrin-like molybdotransferase Glp [Pararhizobium mangrovi]TPW31372.1 molybdopterin molybdotransferase MoeA [Pararhizobium mangrovi]
MALLALEEAIARVLADAVPIMDEESVPLRDARLRHLARDLAATRTQPPFSASAMDGYAVRHADIADGTGELRVVGTSSAGHGFGGGVGAGQAVRIFTGAPLPEGADTVVIQENVERHADDRITFREMTERGRHIRAAGLDFREGDRLLGAGDILDAGRLMLAAAMNHAEVPVRRRPRVAILATGDELVLPGETPAVDQIIASNGFGVRAIVEEAGGVAIDLGVAPDDFASLDAAIDRGDAAGADVLVTLGGASVGDHDLVREALSRRGMALDFWKIAMRPGKPLMFGRLGRQRVLGLPGNPVSSLVCAHLFLRPLVIRLAGGIERDDRRTAVLGRAVGANDERQDYMRARLSLGDEGELVATPFERQDSSMMRVFAQADALVVRPPYAPAADAGEPCVVHCLREGPITRGA